MILKYNKIQINCEKIHCLWLCRGYKPAHAQQAPLWGGALKAGLQHSREEEGGTWELYHSVHLLLITQDCSLKQWPVLLSYMLICQ